MSDRLIPILGFSAVALLGVYLVLMVTAISFATWQTQSASRITELESSIAGLETEYYAAIARINRTDPSSFGLARPTAVRYVTAVRPTTVTFAGR